MRVERAATRSAGCAFEDDPAAVVAGAGSEVDDPVGVRHDRLVTLDTMTYWPEVDQPAQHPEQLLYVGRLVARGPDIDYI